MHWKLPVLLCIISIGFSICQDVTDDPSVFGMTTAAIGGEVDETVNIKPTSEPEAEADPEAEVEPEAEADPEAEVEPEAEAEAKVVAEAETEPEADAETGADKEPDTTMVPNATGEAEADSETTKLVVIVTSPENVVAAKTEPTLKGADGELENPPGTNIPKISESPKDTTEPPVTVEESTAAGPVQPETSEAPTTESKAETTPEPQEPFTLPDPGGEKEQPASPVPHPTAGDVEETTIKDDPIETTTTLVIVTTTEEEVTTTTAPPVLWTGEPCDTVFVLDQAERHFAATVGKEPVNDITLMENWYRFELQGTPAIITSQPIKPEQCGTNLPFHLDLKGKELPAENSNGTYHICSTVKSDHGVITCSETQDIEVKNCGNKYVYKLSPLKTSTKATAGICVQKPIEIVPLHFIAFAQEKTKLDVPTTSVDDVTKEQLDGIVTLELEYPEPSEKKTDTEILSELDKMYRPMVVEALNGAPKPTQAETKETTQEPMKEPVAAPEPVAPAKDIADPVADDDKKIPNNYDTDAGPTGPRAARLVANPRFLYKRELRRQKRSADHEYKVDDVHYVGPTPRIKHSVLQKSIYVDDPETKAVDGDRLLAAVKGLENSGKLKKLGLNVKDIYKGLPKDIQPLIAPVPVRSTWKEHEPVFITIIVLLLLLLLILLIGCCCIKCRNRRGSWTANERVAKK